MGTVDLEELPDSHERTGAPVLWLSCVGQRNDWELFSDNSYLSAILDRQGLMVAEPVDLRTKKAENFSHRHCKGFWSKMKTKNPKIVVMSPTVSTKNCKQKKKTNGNITVCAGRGRGGKQFLIFGLESAKIWC